MMTAMFDRKKRDELRKAYNRAVQQGMEEFMFDGGLYLTAYAKYVLEHLDNQLGD